MSDGTGGFFGGMDLSGLSDADWSNLMAGLNTPNLDLTGAGIGQGIDWNSIIQGQPENGSFVGPDGTDPNGLTGGDYNDLMNVDQGGGMGSVNNPTTPSAGGGGGSGGGSGGGAGGILGTLGGIPGLAGLLAPLLGGILNSNATKNATNQTVAGINKASDQVQGILGQPSPFAPFTQAGQGAMAKLQGMNYQPLAGRFGNLGAGRATTLGAMGRGH